MNKYGESASNEIEELNDRIESASLSKAQAATEAHFSENSTQGMNDVEFASDYSDVFIKAYTASYEAAWRTHSFMGDLATATSRRVAAKSLNGNNEHLRQISKAARISVTGDPGQTSDQSALSTAKNSSFLGNFSKRGGLGGR
ncbi:hypothetical protein AB0H69_48540 [Streptomyces phaeochromogenes]|uniref:hypothetical protein n=1 Tax=Streptomyces phaeochromogenes TaxID=1923 RepID=UPI0033C903C6